MKQGDVLRVLVGTSWVEGEIVVIEPCCTWNGKDLDGWLDAVVIKFSGGRRLRFKRGIVEESPRFQLQPRLRGIG